MCRKAVKLINKCVYAVATSANLGGNVLGTQIGTPHRCVNPDLIEYPDDKLKEDNHEKGE